MIITFLAVGLAAGVLSGIFGIGGGVLMVPALVYLAGMPIKTATGTSLGALLLPVGILGAITYYRDGHLVPHASVLLALGLVVGVYFGARITQELHPAALQRMFAVFLVIMAGRLWFTA